MLQVWKQPRICFHAVSDSGVHAAVELGTSVMQQTKQHMASVPTSQRELVILSGLISLRKGSYDVAGCIREKSGRLRLKHHILGWTCVNYVKVSLKIVLIKHRVRSDCILYFFWSFTCVFRLANLSTRLNYLNCNTAVLEFFFLCNY